MYSYTLPSGLEAELREMTGAEEDLVLAHLRKNPRGAEWVSPLLLRCLVRLGDASPVRSDDLAVLLNGDMTYLLIKLRQISYGDEVTLHLACPQCHLTETTRIALDDLPVTPYPDSREHTCTLPRSGRVVRFRPFDYRMGERAQRLAETAPDRDSLELLLRIVAIDEAPPTKHDLQTMLAMDRDALKQAMKASEGGMDTLVTADCWRCGGTLGANVLSAVDFFMRPLGMG